MADLNKRSVLHGSILLVLVATFFGGALLTSSVYTSSLGAGSWALTQLGLIEHNLAFLLQPHELDTPNLLWHFSLPLHLKQCSQTMGIGLDRRNGCV